jgi:hypothetical protein
LCQPKSGAEETGIKIEIKGDFQTRSEQIAGYETLIAQRWFTQV